MFLIIWLDCPGSTYWGFTAPFKGSFTNKCLANHFVINFWTCSWLSVCPNYTAKFRRSKIIQHYAYSSVQQNEKVKKPRYSIHQFRQFPVPSNALGLGCLAWCSPGNKPSLLSSWPGFLEVFPPCPTVTPTSLLGPDLPSGPAHPCPCWLKPLLTPSDGKQHQTHSALHLQQTHQLLPLEAPRQRRTPASLSSAFMLYTPGRVFWRDYWF